MDLSLYLNGFKRRNDVLTGTRESTFVCFVFIQDGLKTFRSQKPGNRHLRVEKELKKDELKILGTKIYETYKH